MIDDTTGLRGWQRVMHGDQDAYDVVPMSIWLGKIKAAKMCIRDRYTPSFVVLRKSCAIICNRLRFIYSLSLIHI